MDENKGGGVTVIIKASVGDETDGMLNGAGLVYHQVVTILMLHPMIISLCAVPVAVVAVARIARLKLNKSYYKLKQPAF